MTIQRIESHDISVSDLFRDFYAVPDYQREYVWEDGEVSQLLADIHNEMSGMSPDQAPEYFIGSIVVCPNRERDDIYDLIDGQQRMTTLYVTLCAIRDIRRELGASDLSVLESQIADADFELDNVEETHRHRLELQYEDSGNALATIVNGDPVEGKLTLSMKNIKQAHQIAMRFLTSEFGDNIKAINQFYGYLTKKVKLIRIETKDVAKALKIFETINDRGVGLDAMDLLKNLLFMQASPEKFDRLSKVWENIQNDIYNMKERPLRFLRYFIFSHYDIDDVLKEDEIYDWLSKREEQIGYGDDPIKFAEKLLFSARDYANFRNGKNVNGESNRFLDNLRLLGGQATRQHLILLLAGRHLSFNSSDLFSKLSSEIENLLFCYMITREPAKNYERRFAQWAGQIRKINKDDDIGFGELVAETFENEKARLSVEFGDSIGRMQFDKIPLYRLRYVLAKFAQHVELAAHGETDRTRRLNNYIDGYDIEHIFPQNPSTEAEGEFGEFSDPEIDQRLGNLILLEPPINASIKNRPYSEKRLAYPKSNLLLTQSLAKKPKIGVNTRIDRAVKLIKTYETWSEDSVLDRQGELINLSRTVWQVP